MNPIRRQTVLFLLCALVLLGAGYAVGYSRAYDGFYSSEALLDRELVHMDFNSRLLHYTLLGHEADCRRELVQRLQGEVVFVGEQLDGKLTPGMQETARVSMEHARTVMDGHPLAPTSPPTPTERD